MFSRACLSRGGWVLRKGVCVQKGRVFKRGWWYVKRAWVVVICPGGKVNSPKDM